MNEGSAMSKGWAKALAVLGPVPSRSSTVRRVGSAKAKNT
jgi:hypothetical protein